MGSLPISYSFQTTRDTTAAVLGSPAATRSSEATVVITWRYSTSIRVDQWSALAPGWTDGDGSFLSSGGEGRSSSMPSVRDALDGYVQRLNLRENREGEKLEEID